MSQNYVKSHKVHKNFLCMGRRHGEFSARLIIVTNYVISNAKPKSKLHAVIKALRFSLLLLLKEIRTARRAFTL